MGFSPEFSKLTNKKVENHGKIQREGIETVENLVEIVDDFSAGFAREK